jgi:hypothetical protein
MEVNRIKMTNIKSIAIAAIGVGLFSVPIFAQGQEQDEAGGMMKDHHHRRAMRQEMNQKWEAQMKTEDAELDKLVQQMNSATGQKKVDAIAALLNKLVEQHKMMHEKMEKRSEKMSARHRKRMEEKETTSPAPGPKASPGPSAKSSPSTS